MTLAAIRGFEKHSRTTRKWAMGGRRWVWNGDCGWYCIANCFNLSDVACEDALYDVPVFR